MSHSSIGHRNSTTPGFTIVELLIVIIVIGILAAIAIFAYNGIRSRAIDTSMQVDARAAFTTLANATSILGYMPNSATNVNINNGNGFKVSPGNTITYEVIYSTPLFQNLSPIRIFPYLSLVLSTQHQAAIRQFTILRCSVARQAIQHRLFSGNKCRRKIQRRGHGQTSQGQRLSPIQRPMLR